MLQFSARTGLLRRTGCGTSSGAGGFGPGVAPTCFGVAETGTRNVLKMHNVISVQTPRMAGARYRCDRVCKWARCRLARRHCARNAHDVDGGAWSLRSDGGDVAKTRPACPPVLRRGLGERVSCPHAVVYAPPRDRGATAGRGGVQDVVRKRPRPSMRNACGSRPAQALPGKARGLRQALTGIARRVGSRRCDATVPIRRRGATLAGDDSQQTAPREGCSPVSTSCLRAATVLRRDAGSRTCRQLGYRAREGLICRPLVARPARTRRRVAHR